MRRLMAVIAMFGVVACGGTGSQDDGGQEAPVCESHDDCGTDYCIKNRMLVCESARDIEYRCIPCDDPPCKPGPICEVGEICRPKGLCTTPFLEAHGDSCELQGDGSSSCKSCYEDDHCRGGMVCQQNICIG